MTASKGAEFLDRRVIPDSFDWREYDVEVERHKVKPASAYLDEVLALHAGEDPQLDGTEWPWEKANRHGLRFRPGEVTLWAGVNGNRKSMVTTQVALHCMRQHEPVLIESFEMAPRRTLDRMVRQAAGAIPAERWDRAWFRWSENRLYLYDHLGLCSPRNVLAVARYAARELGARHIFIDALMKVVEDPENYREQKAFVSKLCDFARAHETHVHLIAHARKGRTVSEGIDKWSVKGASEIVDQVDNAILVNKVEDGDEKEGEPNQWLEVAKQRNGEFEGKIGLYFDRKSLSFSESADKRWPGIPIET